MGEFWDRNAPGRKTGSSLDTRDRHDGDSEHLLRACREPGRVPGLHKDARDVSGFTASLRRSSTTGPISQTEGRGTQRTGVNPTPVCLRAGPLGPGDRGITICVTTTRARTGRSPESKRVEMLRAVVSEGRPSGWLLFCTLRCGYFPHLVPWTWTTLQPGTMLFLKASREFTASPGRV